MIGPDKGWIGAQFALLAVAGIGGAIEYFVAGRTARLGSDWVSVAAGGLLLAGAAGVLVRAARDLAGNLTASPTPVDDCVLVDSGIYSVVRHPMYLGVLLATGGYGLLLGSRLVFVTIVVLIPFFAAKSRHEEHLLRSRVPGYTDYARRVRARFIPYIV